MLQAKPNENPPSSDYYAPKNSCVSLQKYSIQDDLKKQNGHAKGKQGKLLKTLFIQSNKEVTKVWLAVVCTDLVVECWLTMCLGLLCVVKIIKGSPFFLAEAHYTTAACEVKASKPEAHTQL